MARSFDVSLEGRVALVTGASRNLPAAIARELAAAGAAVAINYVRSESPAEAVAEEIRGRGGRAAIYKADVADRTQSEAMAAAIRRELGPVDILINGAGPFAIDPLTSLPEATWDRILDSNLKAVYLLAQILAPGMIARGWGRIVNLSAGSAEIRNHSVYGLAKNGVRWLTQALALELAPAVTVNAISPSQIEESGADVGAIDPTYVERSIRSTPLGRLVTRREIARMALLICSPLFDFVTGQTIVMDGGKGIPRW